MIEFLWSRKPLGEMTIEELYAELGWTHLQPWEEPFAARWGHIQFLLEEAFGRTRGWRLAKTEFALATLSRKSVRVLWHEDDHPKCRGQTYFDHPRYFRDRHNRAAGIVVNLYSCTPEKYGAEIEKWAGQWRVRVSPTPEPSFYYPGRTVQWLYEPL